MTAKIPVISREYVYATVSPTGSDAAILTTLPVHMAFKADATEPVDADFLLGSWEPGTTNARVLVGPAPGNTLAAGGYSVWLRVSGATERPIRNVGKLVVY